MSVFFINTALVGWLICQLAYEMTMRYWMWELYYYLIISMFFFYMIRGVEPCRTWLLWQVCYFSYTEQNREWKEECIVWFCCQIQVALFLSLCMICSGLFRDRRGKVSFLTNMILNILTLYLTGGLLSICPAWRDLLPCLLLSCLKLYHCD